MLTLDVKKREKVGKSSVFLGQTGEMPAVVYGPKQEAISIVIPIRVFQKVWKEGGESSVIVLKGLGEDKETLIQDVDFDPVTDIPRHADFYAIEKGKKVRVGVPIEFVGVSGAVKELGAVLVKVLHELEIEVMPKDLPHMLEVDLSLLAKLDSQILVKDIKFAAGITVLNKEDEVVAIASEVKDEVVDETPVDLSAIEVEKKGKKEEEGAEADAECPQKIPQKCGIFCGLESQPASVHSSSIRHSLQIFASYTIMSTMLRYIGLLLFVCSAIPALASAQGIVQIAADKRAQLERDLASLESEINVQQQLVTSKKEERQSIERDVSILDASIKKAKLSVKSMDLTIEKLSDTIDDKRVKIVGLDAKIAREKQSLAQLIRKTHQLNDTSVPEIILGKESLSTIFLDIDTFSTIKIDLQKSFEVIEGTKANTLAEKNALEDRKEEKLELRGLQVIEQKRVESQEKEKQQILKSTKGVEATYQQQLKSKQKSAAEIRAALFSLRDSAAIPFGKALEYATQSGQATGVRPALILAILQQETELGANLGTGSWQKDMHPTRDVPVFKAITAFLGLNADTMPVSRKAGLSAWGGAMGPGQFIPSTWACFGGFINTSTNRCSKNPNGSWDGPWEYREDKDRIRQMLGSSRPSNPWEAIDAFTGTAMYMKDSGAAAGTFEAERRAAVRYFAGYKNGDNPTYVRGYGDPVMEHAKYFQTQIDILSR